MVKASKSKIIKAWLFNLKAACKFLEFMPVKNSKQQDSKYDFHYLKNAMMCW